MRAKLLRSAGRRRRPPSAIWPIGRPTPSGNFKPSCCVGAVRRHIACHRLRPNVMSWFKLDFMESIVGVFESLATARRAADALVAAGVQPKYITVLAPGSPAEVWDRVPQSGTEQPGMGEAVGGVVGGAVGVAAGAPLGAALASLLLPGGGPIVGLGIA